MNKTNVVLITIAIGIISIGVYVGSQQVRPMTSTTPDNSTTAGQNLTPTQVATHNTATSCYTIINGAVYDLTTWITQHPGGPDVIVGLCGRDGTEAFSNAHGGQGEPEQTLEQFKIGVVAQ